MQAPLRISIANPAVLAWLVISPTVCVLAQSPGQDVTIADGSGRINTSVFDCAGSPSIESFEFTIRRGAGELALWLPFEFGIPYVVLSRIFDYVGETYEEGDVSLTLVGDSANLQVGKDTFSGCALNPLRSVWEHAKLSGVDYRASGQDPDWYLELRNMGMLVFSSAARDALVEIATPEPEADAVPDRTIYRAEVDRQPLLVEIGGGDCATADGAPITGAVVVVTWHAEKYSGCGRPLH